MWLRIHLYMFLFFSPDMPLERKTPVAYPDGVYEIAGEERGNVLIISNLTQFGLTGRFSTQRTALFTFFGMHILLHCCVLSHTSLSVALQASRLWKKCWMPKDLGAFLNTRTSTFPSVILSLTPTAGHVDTFLSCDRATTSAQVTTQTTPGCN